MAIIFDFWMVRSFVLSVLCAVAALLVVSISAACTIDTTTVRHGLTSLYHSTNGPHWKQNENWLNSSASVCTWHGISEASKGRARIALGASNLSGTLPPELGALSDVMQTLDLQGNALHGSIPQEYSNFSNLEYVMLYNNSLNGTLPESLSSWTLLKKFEIWGNNFTGPIPKSFKTWTQLTKFSVSENFFSGSLPEDFASWAALTDFSLAWNCFSGTLPNAFGAAWTQLQHFGVDYQRANWKPCGELPEAGLTGTLPVSYAPWGSSLLSFRVSHNRLSGTLPAEYGAWDYLSVFEGWLNNISGSIPESYATWTHLTRFMVAGNKLNGTLPSVLRRWTSLESFVINGNCITGTLPDEFSSWTNISKFDVSEMVLGGGLSGTLPISWASWQHVETFALNGNTLSGSIPEAYTAWTQLTALILFNNRLSGIVSSTFGHAWSELTEFAVNHNELSGTLPESLAQWTHLTKLTISNNRFTGSLPAVYKNWSLLKGFDVSSNNLNTSLPSEYSAWHSLETFHAGNQTLLFGTLPSAYAAWGQVKVFSVRLGRLNGSIPDDKFKSWKKLEEFDVRSNSLSGTLPASMGMGCLLLKFFQASENILVGTLPGAFASWSDLQTFDVSHNVLQGTLPVSYGSWTYLQTFGASHNLQITGALPFEYGSGWQSKLAMLDVSYCQLNSTLPEEYGSWTSIQFFYASYNRLSGAIPNSFLQWKKIERVFLDNNNLEGSVPSFFVGVLLLHNNSRLSGTLPKAFSALFVSLCGTDVSVCNLSFPQNMMTFVCTSAKKYVSLDEVFSLQTVSPVCRKQQTTPLSSAPTSAADAANDPHQSTTGYVAGAAAVLASAAGSAASAVAIQRLRLSVRAACSDELATIPVDTISAPIRISIGPASPVADSHRAAVLGNCVLLTAIGLVSVTATVTVAMRSAYSSAAHQSKTDTKISRRRHTQNWSWCSAVGRKIGSAAAMLKLPSAVSLVVSLLFQQTVVSGIVTLRYAQASVDVVLGVAGCVGLACAWLLFLAVVLLMNFHATANPSCLVDPSLPSQRWWSLLSWLVAPQSVWHAITDGRRGARERRRPTRGITQLLRFQASKWYVDQYGFFFRGNSPRCHWWLLCDYVVTVVSVICVATAGSSGVPCVVSSWILVTISGVWCGLTIAMAPKQRRLAQFAQCVTTGVACIVAMCDALSVSPSVTETLVMTASVQHTAASVLVLVGTFLLGKRQQQADTNASGETSNTARSGRSPFSKTSQMLQKPTETELSSSSVLAVSAPVNDFATRPGRACRKLRGDDSRSEESGITTDSSLTSPSAVLERLIVTICRGASSSVKEPCQRSFVR